jgi:hypothetical protein
VADDVVALDVVSEAVVVVVEMDVVVDEVAVVDVVGMEVVVVVATEVVVVAELKVVSFNPILAT